jgi:flavine halogenase
MNQKIYNKQAKRDAPTSPLLSRIISSNPPRDDSFVSPLMARYISNLSLAPGVLKLIGNGILAQKYSTEGGRAEAPIRSASDFSYSAQRYAGSGYRIVGDAGGTFTPRRTFLGRLNQ